MRNAHRLISVLMVLVSLVTLTACQSLQDMLYPPRQEVTTDPLPWEEPPPLTYPDTTPVETDVETTAPETEAAIKATNLATTTIKEFSLSWSSVEQTLVTRGVKGSFVPFNTQGFAIFIPDEFDQSMTESTTSISDTRRLATYTTNDKSYGLTITRGPLPYAVNNIDDILSIFVKDENKTVCKAIINGIPFADIESYDDDKLILIAKATSFIEMDPDEDSYFTFTFMPMSNDRYFDLTMSMLSSIKKIDITETTPVVPPTVETEPPETEAPETEPPETTPPETKPVETEKPETTAPPAPVETQAPVPTPPPHQHVWENVTKLVHHPAKYDTIHHEAQYETIHHDAEYYPIHHEPVYDTIWVVDREGWDEWIIVQDEWYEEVYEEHNICNICGTDFGYNYPSEEHLLREYFDGWPAQILGSHPETVAIPIAYHPAVVQLVQHPEEGHYQDILVQDAYEEWILFRDAWDEDVLIKDAWDETVTTQQAWDEYVVTGQICKGCGATK